MTTTILLALLALAFANPYRSQTPTLVINVTHHPADLNTARLADAVRKACAAPSMKCRTAEPSEATTFLHVRLAKYCKYPAGTAPVDEDCTGGRQVFAGSLDITSQVMIPRSVSVQDESLERLGPSLLALVKDRLEERAGVVVIDRTDAR